MNNILRALTTKSTTFHNLEIEPNLAVIARYSSVLSCVCMNTDRVSMEGDAIDSVRPSVCPSPLSVLNGLIFDLSLLYICTLIMTIARLCLKVNVIDGGQT